MLSLQELIDNSKQEFDLTENSHQASLYELVDQLLGLDLSFEEINAQARSAPLQFKLAAKLIESRHYLIFPRISGHQVKNDNLNSRRCSNGKETK